MICKDCYYFDICDTHAIDRIPEWENRAEEVCQRFKDKNKIIELPCKVGDTVYYICQIDTISLMKGQIYEATVARFVITDLGVSAVIQIHEKGVTEIPDITEFGEFVFLSKADAENKLYEGGRI